MKLRRLRLENFKRFTAPMVLDGFADGLNVFAAPNEAGKSTVAEAVRAAFFERHRSSSVEHLRPWSDASATPTVELEFDLGGRRHRLLKAFLGKRRCELHIEGQPALDGAAAEDHLAQLLGFRFPGKGASTPEHMGIPGLLWIRQGTSHELAEPVQHAANHLRQVLGDSLGDLTASSGDAVLNAVEAARHDLLTPKGGEPRGEYAAALQRVTEATARAEALQRDITAYQGRVDRLAELRAAHERDSRDPPWVAARAQHRAAEAALAAAQGLETRLQAERQAVAPWQAQLNALRGEIEALSRDATAVTTRQQRLAQTVAAEQAAIAEVTAWERRHADAAQADAQARQALDVARDAEALAALQRSADELRAQAAAAVQTLQQAEAHAAGLAPLQAAVDALAVPPATLKRLRAQAEALRDADVQLQAAATRLEFDLRDGLALRLGEETLAGRGHCTLVQPGVLHIDGVGTVTVLPGGADTASLAARRDTLRAELQAQLLALRAGTVAEAEERARQAAQQEAQIVTVRQVLQALAPHGLDALRAEVQGRAAREAAVRAELAQRQAAVTPGAPVAPGADPGPGAAPPLAAARRAAEQAAAALAAAGTALNTARVAAGRAQGDRAAAQQEFDAAQATARDPQRQARAAAASTALAEAQAQASAAQARAEATALELQRVNLNLLRQDVERFDRSARHLEQQHEQRQLEITRLEVELETLGALGLDEQFADGAREREAAVRRRDELARRAAALDHLLTLLRSQRAALARRLRAPLQKHLDHVLGILFPGASIEVGDDLSPGVIRRPGVGGARLDEPGRFDELSVGTREQMGIVARLAYADLLQEAGRPTLLILDDALVHTDEDRLGRMKRVLYDAAQRHQVLIFTCHPAAWRDLGVVAKSLPTPA